MPVIWLELDSTDMPACISIWFLVMLVLSWAKSASMMRPFAMSVFSFMLERLLTVCSRRLMLAPKEERTAPI
ncbi:hypothetical protein D3C77_572450 [compost metagenome]